MRNKQRTEIILPTSPSIIVNQAAAVLFSAITIICGIKYTSQTTPLFVFFNQTLGGQLGTLTDVPANATEYARGKFTSSSLASSSACIAQNVAGVTLGVFRKWQARVRATQIANSRYWLGFSSQTSPAGSATFRNNNPNLQILAFRWSAGLDANWKAFYNVVGGSSIVIDTGVPIDTVSSHLFEIDQLPNGIIAFSIDGKQVASVNLHSISGTVNMATVMPAFVTLDNEGVAVAVALEVAWMFVWGQ